MPLPPYPGFGGAPQAIVFFLMALLFAALSLASALTGAAIRRRSQADQRDPGTRVFVVAAAVLAVAAVTAGIMWVTGI